MEAIVNVSSAVLLGFIAGSIETWVGLSVIYTLLEVPLKFKFDYTTLFTVLSVCVGLAIVGTWIVVKKLN